MIDQRINSCLTFCQGKCPHFTITERFFLFPQILNAIDIELAEGNCLDCEKYVDRRVSQQSRSGRRDAPSKESDYGAQNEKRQHGRTAVRLPIHILAADGSRQGETEDISLGGAFIRCEKPPLLLLGWSGQILNLRAAATNQLEWVLSSFRSLVLHDLN
jgi:hypothetical protein